MTSTILRASLSALLFTGLAVSSPANVALPSIFSDHAVLQKTDKVPVWGNADANEKVTVTIDKVTASTTTGADGKWKVELDLKNEGAGPYQLVVQGADKLTIQDVLIGEVWFCSGQSNMAFPLSAASTAKEEIPQSANSQLREFQAVLVASPDPQDDNKGKWLISSPQTAGGFTAVGYYFGKKLQNELKTPIGLVHSSMGGSPIETWIRAEALDTDPDLKQGKEKSLLTPFTPTTNQNPFPASYYFNGMIHPFLSYAIAGVIWYQGESNQERGFQYRISFPLLINDWRKQWGQGDFPFYYCQLANRGNRLPQPGNNNRSELCESQTLALSLPNTGQAVLIDIGEEKETHFRNKKEAGERLALIALAKTYGKQVIYSGPMYDSMQIEGDKIRIKLKFTDGGLVAKPLPATYQPLSASPETKPLVRNSPNSMLEGFSICGEDKKWHWADAKIDRNDVIVWSDEIKNPIAVRYAWEANPICNLSNSSGLPACPFRTDNFPCMTEKARY